MNSRFPKTVFFLLLILGTGSAFAQSGDYVMNRRETVYFYAQEAMPPQSIDQSRQVERRRMQELNSSGFDTQGNEAAGNLADPSRRQGKLSPEQRRALRQQIDQAGHDIYSPRR